MYANDDGFGSSIQKQSTRVPPLIMEARFRLFTGWLAWSKVRAGKNKDEGQGKPTWKRMIAEPLDHVFCINKNKLARPGEKMKICKLSFVMLNMVLRRRQVDVIRSWFHAKIETSIS